MSDARTKLAGARLRARDACPYLATALWSLIPVETNKLPEYAYLATDAKYRLYYSEGRMAEQATEEVAGSLIHEVSHLLRGHYKRGEHLENHMRANVAGDLAINPDLRSLNGSAKLPAHVLFPDQFGLPDGLSLEEYYHRLPDPPQGTGVGNGACGGCAGNPLPGEEDAAKDAEQEGISGRGEADQTLIQRAVAGDIRRHVEAHGKGSVPGEWERWAEELLGPAKVDWRRELRATIRRAIAVEMGKVDFTYTRPSRRQSVVTDVALPGTHKPVPDIAVVVDTSGSMSDRQLGEALREVKGVLQTAGGGVRVFSCDAAVHACQKVFTAKQVHLSGGGGTSMAEGVRTVCGTKPKPNLVVVLTDGLTDVPSEQDAAGVSLVWVILGNQNGARPNFGRTVVIEDEGEAHAPAAV